MPVTAAPAPVVALRGVAVGYDERPAVRDVDLTIERGEVVALVGPNGSGKTTLVRGVLGLARVQAGTVELFGVPADRFTQRHRIGYVPQRHTVGGGIPSTVEEVVSSGRLTRRRIGRTTAADRAAVAAAIEAVDLTERRRATVASLSGGQQRRTLIARALAGEPEVLVMDEPTAGVDAESQTRLVETLERLVAGGLTLLVVTHETAPLRPILTRVVTLEAGRLVGDVALDRRAPAPLDVTAHEGHDTCHDTDPDADPVPAPRRSRSPLPAWGGLPGLARWRR